MNQLNLLNDLISSTKQQLTLLEAEVSRLENTLSMLTVVFSNGIEHKFRTDYSKYYANNAITLSKIYSSKCRLELLDILFAKTTETTSVTYNYIYGNEIMPMKHGYELMRMIASIYSAAIDNEEKERIKCIYNKILAKNMYIANFMNCGGNLTEEMVKDLIVFIEILDKCVLVRSCLSVDFNALNYLMKNKLPYDKVYDIILEKIKKWTIESGYTCLYTIGK